MIIRAAGALCVAAAFLSLAGAAAARGGAVPVGTSWASDAKSFRGQNGSQLTYQCPAGGGFTSTWGTDVYTDDSSVCTAAVHAGKITQALGGTVTIEIRPGLSAYTGTARNGVTTTSYGSWSGSFAIVGSSGGSDASGVRMGPSGWGETAAAYRGQTGNRYSYLCPGGGTPGSVWGTSTYTDDSSVCSAAVHAGLISLSGGGKVVIEIRPGLSAYAGVTHNGITSRSYHAWSGSFVFPAARKAPAGSSTGGGTAASQGGSTWSATATGYRGQNGHRYRYTCPSNGQAGSVWGTTIYTDDSSVCTAAVHAGRLGFAAGGAVTIEIRPARSSYTGSTSHGVTSKAYGPWHGSYIFVSG